MKNGQKNHPKLFLTKDFAGKRSKASDKRRKECREKEDALNVERFCVK
ncbi:MAG: hypothetical protein PT947_03735 [Suipraeoptans intestinalis]|nr:hypothetical protein [Suipraeoptans intestinalis]